MERWSEASEAAFLAYVDSLQIPTEAGRVFRFEAGHRSDMKPATIPN
jgi:hypothetical protein